MITHKNLHTHILSFTALCFMILLSIGSVGSGGGGDSTPKKRESYDPNRDNRLEEIQKQKQKAWELGEKGGGWDLYQEFEESERLYKKYH